MIDRATKGDEQYPCPRCRNYFKRGETIQQSQPLPIRIERRATKRDIEWTHVGCQPA